jgi:hypothetical protein
VVGRNPPLAGGNGGGDKFRAASGRQQETILAQSLLHRHRDRYGSILMFFMALASAFLVPLKW